MKKNSFPFLEKVKSCAIILPRWWHLSFLLTFFSLFTLSAQKIHVDSLATANITVVGDACIYSKDEAFNEQISNNKILQQYSKVIRFNDNEIRIIAKNSDVQSSTKQNFERAKPEKKLLVSRKKTIEISDLPEKEIPLKISNGLDGTRFLTGNALGNIPFISPSNNYYNAKIRIKIIKPMESQVFQLTTFAIQRCNPETVAKVNMAVMIAMMNAVVTLVVLIPQI